MVGSAHPTEVSIAFAIRSFDRTYRVGSYKIELSDQKRLVRSAHPTEVSIVFAIRSFDRAYRVGLYKVELSDQKRLVRRGSLSQSLLGSLSHSLISRLISFDRTLQVLQRRNRVLRKKLGF